MFSEKHLDNWLKGFFVLVSTGFLFTAMFRDVHKQPIPNEPNKPRRTEIAQVEKQEAFLEELPKALIYEVPEGGSYFDKQFVTCAHDTQKVAGMYQDGSVRCADIPADNDYLRFGQENVKSLSTEQLHQLNSILDTQLSH